MGVSFKVSIPHEGKSFFEEVEYCREVPGNRLTVNAFAQSRIHAHR